MGEDNYGINSKVVASYAEQIQNLLSKNVQVAIVIGGGNIFRGMTGVGKGFDRVKGDQMGLLWEAHVSALHMTGGRGVGWLAAAQSIFL